MLAELSQQRAEGPPMQSETKNTTPLESDLREILLARIERCLAVLREIKEAD
jgi:hypothetical protein